MGRGKYTLLFILVVMAVVFSAPFWWWILQKDHTLNVLMVDKTVPDTTYREHRGLTWLLNNNKYTKPDGSRYNYRTDYTGFMPGPNHTYQLMGYPDKLSGYDLVYLTDQYGVYQDEFYGTNQEGNRSESIYGGVTKEEADRLDRYLNEDGGTLMAEFNTFGSPTDEAVKQQLYRLLNLKWTGWIGRPFDKLESTEVPVWVRTNYEKQTGNKWSYTGEGIVFTNESDHVVVLDKTKLDATNVKFAFTDEGKRQLGMNGSADYSYWFDIIEAGDPDEVLAQYTVAANADGAKILEEEGLPSVFPAVVHHLNAKGSSYYFAGDLADNGQVPDFYRLSGYGWVMKKFSARLLDAGESFYWRIYTPMMENILKGDLHARKPQEKVETVKLNGVTVNGKAGKDYLQVMKNGQWQDLVIKGVNMGIAKPGAFPGETAITKEEYARWFQEIGAMNANTVRVYTTHPPAFYEALKEYNETAEKPLYLFQGVWVDEESLVSSQNAYDEKVTAPLKQEIKNLVDVIHGKAVIPKVAGYAGGTYTADVSDYVLGWVLGIEWDPGMVKGTNDKNAGLAPYQGPYFRAKEEANPFEGWLASMMDYMASYETETYAAQRMMSFTNWVTTDLLQHPHEPLDTEDMVSVDPNHIGTTQDYAPGMFASYHIYPYYPDFLNYTPEYKAYKNKDGQPDSYAGYLHAMKAAHTMPMLVAEFGIPASRGMTHKNVDGRNQGAHSEKEQGELIDELFRDILDEKMAGGLVFSWQDEWFKRTWNTMDLDNPDRRPYWNNIQTSEEHFGLLSFDPGKYELPVQVDGSVKDWQTLGTKPLYETDQGKLRKLYAASDSEYLYLRLDYDKSADMEHLDTKLLLDSIDGQGNTRLTPDGALRTEAGIDFLLQLNGEKDSRLTVDSYYDPNYFKYGKGLGMVPQLPYEGTKDSGVFHPVTLTLNKTNAGRLPDGTVESHPYDSYETGLLKKGNGNPKAKDYDSMADFAVNAAARIVEVRIPWLNLNMRDPSLHEAMGDLWKDGLTGSVTLPGIRIAAVTGDGTGSSGGAVTLPALQDGRIPLSGMALYKWDEWQEPVYHERLKPSYFILQKAYADAP